ncbi:transmembrane protein 205 [Anoplophora glabripennis]|uniref:Transmembrane protein n=1 Tax=Anoplophora glabripennis TaxID=217634 RepID=V5I9Z9_ANOGL|nr:transmembrane protein 205 [Anoplophora glabripennis]
MCVGRSPSATVCDVTGKVSNHSVHKKQPKIVNENGDKLQYKEDLLAVATYYTKVCFDIVGELHKAFLKSTFFKILFHTTQPAHLITAFSVLCVAYLMLPSKSYSQISPIWTLVYLGSFSAHFGAQIWMTFVSGLALYFTLPRHIFGNVQRVLFPKYFLINATLSLITLAIFLRTNNSNLRTAEIAIQASGMTICFLVELVIRLYLTPPLLALMVEKNTIEKRAGVGMEIGKLNPGKLLNCPHYLQVHKQFRKVHMSIAILNIVTMACTMLHLYYLSHKLCAL